ncbi:MAG: hypothetical protein LBB23_02205 [Rickettsiales bacterium]|nr:hypothetical protein [Rickettsiales bacterium]
MYSIFLTTPSASRPPRHHWRGIFITTTPSGCAVHPFASEGDFTARKENCFSIALI